tara:strand:+ start:138 stop:1610 length:1473 start_codon:yes stop_codon:yes gene_type:complete
MSDFPFSIPRRGDADVVNGVSYAGDTLTLTRAEGSDLTTTIATGDPVTGVSYSGDTLSLSRATGADLTTTIATSDPTKIENGTSKMEIENAAGACVFTPAGSANTTTFATDGDITTSGDINCSGNIVSALENSAAKSDFGFTSIGNVGYANYAGFSHTSMAGTTGKYALLQNSVGETFINAATGKPINFLINNTIRAMKILSTGEVGINNITPSEILDVGGNIKLTGNIRGNGSLDLYGNTSSTNSFGWMEMRSDKTVLGGSLLKFYTNSTGTNLGSERMTILSTGEVGINKAAPEEKLHVDGNIKVTGNILGNGVEIATTSGACVFTPNGNAALATTFFADGKFNVNQQIRFNDLKGIGHAIDFLGLPNIQVGSAYAFANTNVGQTFERLMSYSKIGNMLNINGHFVFKPTATTGTAYMNYYDIGLAGGIDNKVYIISDLGNGIFTSITADAPNSRLLFNFTVGSSAVNVTQVATLKFFCGLSFRGSYG